MTRVTLDSLTVAYPAEDMLAVHDLTLDIPSGSLTALLGPSGAGKSTILKAIAGLVRPTAGDIAFDGQSVLGLKPEDRGAVMVFQDHLLFPYMSVAENIGFGLRMRKRPRSEIAARVAEMLDLVRLPGLGTRKPSELSGGQQQRVALARALVTGPKVLLLDEPLSSLDAHLRGEMRDLIATLQRDTGITTLVVTHDQEEAVILADRIALIEGGRLRQYAAPETFFRRPADAAVARFFGARNFVSGHAQGGVFGSALGDLRLPDGAPDGPGFLTIRPEAIRLGPAAENALTVAVTARQYLGTATRLILRHGETTLEAILPPDAAESLLPGAEITIHLPRQALWVLPPEAP